MKKIPTMTSLAWMAASLLGACGGSGGGSGPATTGDEPPVAAPEPETVLPEPGPQPQEPPLSPNGLVICGTGISPGADPPVDRVEPCETLLPMAGAAGQAGAAMRAMPGKAALQHTAVVQLEPLVQAMGMPGMPEMPETAAPALQIGVARHVALTADSAATRARLHWQAAGPDGAQVAALRFVSPAAHGVRLGVLVEQLPAGAVLRVYGASGAGAVEIGAAALHAMMARNARDAEATPASIRTWWSPDFGGDSTTLEVEIPPGADPQAVRIAVPRLSHHTLDVDRVPEFRTKDVGDAAACHVDAVCRPEAHLERRSVTRMIFVRPDGNAYLCTGTLLNNAQNDGKPYLLSASHCISTNSVAETLITDWFFHADACGSSLRHPGRVRVTGGATLHATSALTDVTLLELTNPPPPGVVYAGSFFGDAPPVGTAVSSVHHPAGDLQKFSAGEQVGTGACNIIPGSGNMNCTPAGDTFWVVRWQQGGVEGGSSGSSLRLREGSASYVIGQLSGGQAVCTPAALSFYGRMDKAWPQLQGWLNPGP